MLAADAGAAGSVAVATASVRANHDARLHMSPTPSSDLETVPRRPCEVKSGSRLSVGYAPACGIDATAAATLSTWRAVAPVRQYRRLWWADHGSGEHHRHADPALSIRSGAL